MREEINVFLSALCVGVTTGFIYDLLRMKRRAIKTRRIFIGVEDVLFWVIAALLTFAAAYISNQGEIRFYFFMAMVLGISIYFWLFSRWITQIITFTVNTVVWPFAKLYCLLKPPAKRFAALVGKGTQKTVKKLHVYRLKTGLRFRSFRNIMRKI
ncbi:MAG: spore cortex biosynthesis protein YabQ [Clostridiaceae bacterium]|jgi:spore cortex biosynthesis protein YabQ|nr:spore cortex biosynthesis protein YabQ [Clostridiaceae bacterium]